MVAYKAQDKSKSPLRHFLEKSPLGKYSNGNVVSQDKLLEAFDGLPGYQMIPIWSIRPIGTKSKSERGDILLSKTPM